MSEDIYRAIGRLEGKVDTIDSALAEMREELKDVVQIAHQARGGFRTLVGVGSIAGAVGSAFTAFIIKIKGGQ
jgi:prefoldin subunit 5